MSHSQLCVSICNLKFPKKFQRIHKEFTKKSQIRTLKIYIPKQFLKNSQRIWKRIPKEFPEDSQKILTRAYRSKSFSSLFPWCFASAQYLLHPFKKRFKKYTLRVWNLVDFIMESKTTWSCSHCIAMYLKFQVFPKKFNCVCQNLRKYYVKWQRH